MVCGFWLGFGWSITDAGFVKPHELLLGENALQQ
jgi:hypothetical protein